MRHRIDWFKHYQEKLPLLFFKKMNLNSFGKQDRPLVQEITKWKPVSTIEFGCGLARTSFVLAKKGIKTSVFDKDKRILNLVKSNARTLGLKVKLLSGDLLEKPKIQQSHDLGFSSGVLEHYDDKDIVRIIKNQLSVVPLVVFSVPIKSSFNRKYFMDKTKIFRRLLTARKWRRILKQFNLVNFKVVRTRHDDLVVVIKR